jgi:putative ABC transport system substrate-binding protein
MYCHRKGHNLSVLVRFFFLVILLGLYYSGGCTPARNFKIGIIINTSGTVAYLEGFKAGLAELGYIEGENVNFVDYGFVNEANSDLLIGKLRAASLDLIFTAGEALAPYAREAAEGKTPIIFAPFLNPGGNITGVQLGNIADKGLEWLIKVAPKTKKLLVLDDPTVYTQWLEKLLIAGRVLGIKIVVREVKSETELKNVLANYLNQVDAVFPVPETLLFENMNQIIKEAIEHKVPLAVSNGTQVKAGALLAYGTNRRAVGKQAARIADQVLNGISPGELPVETAEYFLSINLKTAGAIGLEIPNAILRQADYIFR